jgi:predicted PurR-regulated permease PerM
MRKEQKEAVKTAVFITISVIAILFFFFLLYKIRGVIPPILYGAFVAYLLLPVTEFLNKKMPRFLASLLSILIFILIFTLLGYLLIPQVVKQIGEAISRTPEIMHSITEYINGVIALVPGAKESNFVNDFLSHASSNLESNLMGLLQNITTLVLKRVSMIPAVFVSLVLAFFFMKDSRMLFNVASNFFDGDKNKKWISFLKESDKDVRDYYSVILLIALTTGGIMGLMSYFVGVPYYIMIGAMDSVLELLPYIGPTIVFTIGSIFALFVSLKTFILFAIFFFLIEFVQSQIAIPHFAGERINLPPLAVILIIILGGSVGGILGVIIAVPTFLIVRNAIKYFYPGIYSTFTSS